MRAADDFTAIHARLEELRHEQERPAGGDKEEHREECRRLEDQSGCAASAGAGVKTAGPAADGVGRRLAFAEQFP